MPRLLVAPVADAEEARSALDVWAAARTAVTSPPTRQRRERVAAKLAESPVALLARYGDRPAGMAVAETFAGDAGCGHVSMLFVDPAWWGNGIGGALVRALQAPPEGTGWSALSGWTREDNVRGQRLYLGRGFVDTGERASLHEGDRILRLSWSR